MHKLLTTFAVLFTFVVGAQPQPTTKPLTVYRQPASSAKTWHDRGVTIAFGYESNGGAVSTTQWETAWTSLGCKVIREPGNNQTVDANDDNLLGVLCTVVVNGKVTDEIDNAVVTTRDTPGGDPEAVYVAVEQFYAKWHNLKPVVILVGLEQLRWKLPNGQPKVDYARLARSCTQFAVDYYPVQRHLPLADYTMLIDQLAAIAPGKVKIGFLECSHQHLNPTYYPYCRSPTPQEWTVEMKGLTDRQMMPGLFPQQIGEDGAGFKYDAMPLDLLSALASWVSPAPAPADPFDGTTITLPNGKTYILKAQP